MSNKTTRELTKQAFVQFLKNNNIYQFYKENCSNNFLRLKGLDKSLFNQPNGCRLLADSFTWSSSAEGGEFWKGYNELWKKEVLQGVE